MSDEQATSGGTNPTPVNTTATAGVPNQVPVMDIVPPPVMSSAPGEVAVVDAPPEAESFIPVSDEIAEQIAADSTMPPDPEPSTITGSADFSAEIPGMATAPQETEPQTAGAGDSPSELIEAEIQREAALPVQAVAKVPKVHNPAQAAIVATIIITIILAGLAVFAYMASQN